MKKIILTLAVCSIALTGISFAAEKGVDGANLLEKRCSVCHPSARPKGVKKSPAEWEKTVTRMIGKGANLNAAEKKTLIDYLSKTYKP